MVLVAAAFLALAWPYGAQADLDVSEREFLGLLNAYRQESGLEALPVDEAMNGIAEWRTQDMLAKDYFSHQGFGSGPCWGGEILAKNTMTAEAAFQAFQESPRHDAAMLIPWFTGVGISYEAPFWAVEFGNPCVTVPVPEATPVVTPAVPAPTSTPVPNPGHSCGIP